MNTHQLDGLAIYSFETKWIGTNMYVLICQDEALIVDPHFDDDAWGLLEEKQIKNIVVFLTHEHPDHTRGVPNLVKNYKTTVVCQKECAKAVADKRSNRPVVMLLYLKNHNTEEKEKFLKDWENYTITADVTFDNDLEYQFGEHKFKFIHAPGHSKGGCLIYMDNQAVFTGDNLILNTPVITRFPGGSTEEYNSVTKSLLDAIDDEMLILPGHGPVFKMKEAKQ